MGRPQGRHLRTASKLKAALWMQIHEAHYDGMSKAKMISLLLGEPLLRSSLPKRSDQSKMALNRTAVYV